MKKEKEEEEIYKEERRVTENIYSHRGKKKKSYSKGEIQPWGKKKCFQGRTVACRQNENKRGDLIVERRMDACRENGYLGGDRILVREKEYLQRRNGYLRGDWKIF